MEGNEWLDLVTVQSPCVVRLSCCSGLGRVDHKTCYLGTQGIKERIFAEENWRYLRGCLDFFFGPGRRIGSSSQ